LSIQFKFKMNLKFEHTNFLSLTRASAATNSRGIGGRGAVTEDGTDGGARASGGGGVEASDVGAQGIGVRPMAASGDGGAGTLGGR
jgi:hypothetical protein